MKLKLSFFLLLSALVAGCQKPEPPAEYSQIAALDIPKPTAGINSIRLQAIQDTALSIGAQGGLSWRAHQLDNMLVKNQDNLGRIFNFNALILNNNVLPPVLLEGQNTLNLASDTTLRLSDRIYKIELPPRFVTAAPTWRDYLWLSYPAPQPPNATLLPKSDAERQVWNTYIKTGWDDGVNQANQIFAINLGRLRRDYAGMILYRELLAQNMVSAPYVAKLDLGVTGDGNLMRINDQVLRITATSQLNTNAKQWKPVLRPGQAGGEDQEYDQANP